MARAEAERGGEPLVRSRTLPLLAGYWSFGQFWGVWVILVLEYQRQHALTESRLGLMYSLLSVAAIGTMLAGAPRLQRLSLRTSVPASLACLAVGSIGLAVQPTSLVLVTFVVVGVGNGLIDVYLNVAAQREESRSRRPVLQWLHASYALGGVTGAAAAGALRTVGLDHRIGLAASGVALLATAGWNARRAVDEPAAEGAGALLSVSALGRNPMLWIPALTVLFCFLVEGSMDIWSGLYLREELGASAGAAGAAFAAFAGALFVGRLFAAKGTLRARRTSHDRHLRDRCRDRRDDRRALRHHRSRGGRLPPDGVRDVGRRAGWVQPRGGNERDPSAAIAAVATVGYTGFIWSPPLLGWIAGTVDLRAAMGVIVFATLGITVMGFFAPRKPPG